MMARGEGHSDIVKLLEETGSTEYLAWLLSPLMSLVGLPDSMGLVWATAMLSNIYAGMVVFFSVSAGESLSVAQVTVLGTMILVAHALPIEGAVAKMAGVSKTTAAKYIKLIRAGHSKEDLSKKFDQALKAKVRNPRD